ncbi:MAG: transketolase [Candidatus Aceula meridiana]|nr:transketolase [Candidatus Aceula meridiana]
MKDKDYRKAIGRELLAWARKDSRIVLLVCDMGFGVVDDFKKEFPERIFNFGMMEQATVGIASGMAASGLIPVVYSIVNFLAFRALEQIRNDVVNQNLNVKFIATGVDNYFRFLGISHCCGKDDKALMKIVGLKVYDPYKGKPNFSKMVKQWMKSREPGYLRV